MHISILKCGPGLLFIGLRWPSVQVEFDTPALDSTFILVLFTHRVLCSRPHQYPSSNVCTQLLCHWNYLRILCPHPAKCLPCFTHWQCSVLWSFRCSHAFSSSSKTYIPFALLSALVTLLVYTATTSGRNVLSLSPTYIWGRRSLNLYNCRALSLTPSRTWNAGS
jgi:hypothetical protein